MLGNALDLPITEHATDTHGVTFVNFALFDLVGLLLSPRIRDLGKITLCRTDTPRNMAARFPHAGPLLTVRLNEDLIASCWDDLLRVAGSLKFGQAAAEGKPRPRGHFPGDDAVVKLLWLAIINIEDKRARERVARRQETGKHSDQPAREGQRVMGWREALNELDIAYPGRIR